MPKAILLLFSAITLSQAGADAFEPSVFEQMRAGGGQSVEGKIKDIDILSEDVYVLYIPALPALPDSRGTEGHIQSIKLCEDFDPSHSDTLRTAYFRERLMDLRQARNKKETVKLVMKGPWNPCLLGVRTITRTQTARAN